MTTPLATPSSRHVPRGAVAALAADAELLVAGAPGLSGRVHSAFDKAANISTTAGTLIALTARTAPDAPASIRIDAASLAAFRLAPGDRVVQAGSLLRAGDHLLVDLASATPWQPRMTSEPLRADRVQRAERALAALQVAGGAVRGEGLFAAAIAARVDSALAVIRTATGSRDAVAIRAAASTLVGLGVGLTPTGDDVLTGLAFAAFHLAAGRPASPLGLVAPAIAHAVQVGTTHELSLTMLRQACRGRASQPLVSLLNALCGEGAPESVDPTMAELIGIGHTSGTDQATGLLAAVHITEELRGR